MGEMADYILNGDDCEGCGEYIGPGQGFPRKCGICKVTKQQPGKDGKQARRSARRREKENEVFKLLEAWAEKNGYDLKPLQPWHLRISHHCPPVIIDLFPQRKKFHHVSINERGTYENEIDFLNQRLKL